MISLVFGVVGFVLGWTLCDYRKLERYEQQKNKTLALLDKELLQELEIKRNLVTSLLQDVKQLRQQLRDKNVN